MNACFLYLGLSLESINDLESNGILIKLNGGGIMGHRINPFESIQITEFGMNFLNKIYDIEFEKYLENANLFHRIDTRKLELNSFDQNSKEYKLSKRIKEYNSKICIIRFSEIENKNNKLYQEKLNLEKCIDKYIKK